LRSRTSKPGVGQDLPRHGPVLMLSCCLPASRASSRPPAGHSPRPLPRPTRITAHADVRASCIGPERSFRPPSSGPPYTTQLDWPTVHLDCAAPDNVPSPDSSPGGSCGKSEEIRSVNLLLCRRAFALWDQLAWCQSLESEPMSVRGALAPRVRWKRQTRPGSVQLDDASGTPEPCVAVRSMRNIGPCVERSACGPTRWVVT